ncbi:MAG: glutathione S-transferase family protein [Proteobacteria bacterium]|nr:glutathione S-transferase family protein [Pseudomonadota bacterium]
MSNITLIIGNKNYSSWSLRPWLYLKHFNIPFEEIRIPLYSEGSKEKILQYSPSGKVPAIKHGDANVWDSLAIMEYLADIYPTNGSWPEKSSARAFARSVSAEMHSGFFALREYLPMNCRRVYKDFKPPESAVADIDRVKQIWTECRERYGKQGPWLFGDFSIADCMYAPVVMRFHSYSVAVSPILQEYMESVKGHAAMVEWIAASKAETEVIASVELD